MTRGDPHGATRRPALAAALIQGGLDAATLAPLFPDVEPEVYCLDVAGARALEHWEALRTLTPTTGFWPVVLSDRAGVDSYVEFVRWQAAREGDAALAAAASLRDAAGIEPAAWLRERARTDPLCVGGPGRGPWPAGVRSRRVFSMPWEFAPRPDGMLALVPTPIGWEAPRTSTGGSSTTCSAPPSKCGSSSGGRTPTARRWSASRPARSRSSG